MNKKLVIGIGLAVLGLYLVSRRSAIAASGNLQPVSFSDTLTRDALEFKNWVSDKFGRIPEAHFDP